MAALPEAVIAPVFRKLEKYTELTEDDRDAFKSLPFSVQSYTARQHVARIGDRVGRCGILLSGFAYRYKILADGGRQILAIHLPGDFVDLQHALFGSAVHSIQMLTEGKLAFVPTSALEDLVAHSPAVQRGLWLDTLQDASIFSEWITNVGRRDARTRIAHLLCEVAMRLRAIGMIEAGSYSIPMSQEQLADATGLTSVHVNRTLHSLRANGLIRSNRRSIIIEDWDQLVAVGDFDASYLRGAALNARMEPRAQLAPYPNARISFA